MREFLRTIVWINWLIVALAVSAIVAGVFGAILAAIVILSVTAVVNIYGGRR